MVEEVGVVVVVMMLVGGSDDDSDGIDGDGEDRGSSSDFFLYNQ